MEGSSNYDCVVWMVLVIFVGVVVGIVVVVIVSVFFYVFGVVFIVFKFKRKKEFRDYCYWYKFDKIKRLFVKFKEN